MTDLSPKSLPGAPAEPQELDTDRLRAFVERVLEKRETVLSVMHDHPPPFYLLETGIVADRARRFKETFQGELPLSKCFYAVKSNAHPRVAQSVLDCGFGLDVSSGLELAMGVELDARQMVFSGPGKTDAELQLAAAHADRVVVLLDSPGELKRLEAVACRAGREVRCGVRLTTNPTGLWRKFGIPMASLPEFWRQARECPHVQIGGLQFHSSWNLSPDNQIEIIATLGRTLAEMPSSFLNRLTFLDSGGGYWPEQGEWLQSPDAESPPPSGLQTLRHYWQPASPLAHFAKTLGDALRRHVFPQATCRIWLEPGRWICNDAVQLIMTVVDCKAADLVITDAGTNAVGWERFETDYFPVVNLTRPALEEKPCHILGSLCTPHDVWGYAYFGETIREGDVLMIPSQGAYTYSLRQQFIKPLPEFVVR